MEPEIHKQLFITKHAKGIFSVLILILVLPLIVILSQTPTSSKSKAESAAITSTTSLASTPVSNSPAAVRQQGSNSSSTIILLNICLHGIGNCGDNVVALGTGNLNPRHPNRQVKVDILSTDNKLLKSATGEIVYSPASSRFTGSINLTDARSGSYNIKISVPGFLSKFIPTPQSLIVNESNTFPLVSLVTGNIDNNNLLDMEDYKLLMRCFGKTNPCSASQQQASDLNDDGVVDGVDYNLFMREIANQKTLK